MKQSQVFIYTFKDAPKELQGASAVLLWKAGFIDQLASGIYSFLPLGWRVHQKISKIISQEMDKIGGQEVYLPSLQPKALWLETSRWDKIDPPLFKLKDRHDKDLALGSTHEEVITEIIRKRIKSFKDLPFMLYQIQVKFRNELRPTLGLLRTREFVMKDAYSFHSDEKDFQGFYKLVISAYKNIFRHCGICAVLVEADPGTIGGKSSHEFMVLAESGEDKVVLCPKCDFAANFTVFKEKHCPKCKSFLLQKNCIEIAHIFNLNNVYSQKMGAYFLDNGGKRKPLLMGCYGIGIGRLMASIVEASNDQNGIIWPKEISPFQIHLLTLEQNKKVLNVAAKIYQDLENLGFEVLFDDRSLSFGQKLVESDLIGIPLRLVVSSKTVEKNAIEVKSRAEKKVELIKISSLVDKVKKLVEN